MTDNLIKQEGKGWYFRDPGGIPIGPCKDWNSARNLFMAFCLDRRGIGDQDLLYTNAQAVVESNMKAT